MSLSVENGTGLAKADSYLSLNGFTKYWEEHNPDFVISGFSDEQVEAALRRATTYIDGRYRGRWVGVEVKGRLQALAWPRKASPPRRGSPSTTFAKDNNGYDVDNASVPREVVAACAECAAREVAAPGSLTPDTTSQQVLSVSVAGAISQTFSPSGDQRPVIVIADEILAPLTFGNRNTTFLMRA